MDKALLQKLGLSDGEMRIYLTLLNLGPCPLGRIHESVGIERRNIYDILNKLIERGLVTYVTENRHRVFHTTHPSKIISYIEEKEGDIKRTRTAFEKEIPALIQLFNATRPTINAEIYRGKEGMKAAWDDMLNCKDLYWIGAGRYMPKSQPHYFANWNKRRIKQRMKIYNILRHELRKEIVRPYELEQTRFLPKDFSGNPTVIGIFGNKVGNFIFGDEPFVFVIESKELAENYRRYHKYLWDNVAKP
jgi:sugar-specific transcriptional regulator TrmB